MFIHLSVPPQQLKPPRKSTVDNILSLLTVGMRAEKRELDLSESFRSQEAPTARAQVSISRLHPVIWSHVFPQYQIF